MTQPVGAEPERVTTVSYRAWARAPISIYVPAQRDESYDPPMDLGRILDIPTVWLVVGITVPTLIGVGVGVIAMTPASFRVARACFAMAAIALAIGAVAHIFSDYAYRSLLATLVLLANAALFVGAIRWVNSREVTEGFGEIRADI